MKRPLFAIAIILSTAAASLFSISCATVPNEKEYRVSLTVSNDVINMVDSRLFGQVLEKTSDEPGPELVVNQSTGSLDATVLSMIKDMKVPVVRFPAGANLDYTDWRDTVNNVPNRPRFRNTVKEVGENKVLLRFGVDEFCRLKRELGFEAIMVVNLLDALAKRQPVREAAETAAGLIAYCNTPETTKLPESLASWPAVRSKNGNPSTFGVEYVQLGTELWRDEFSGPVRAAVSKLSDKDLVQWYVDCISVYIQLIKTADPGIKIILDGKMGGDIAKGVFADSYIRENVDYLSWHNYAIGDNAALGESIQLARDIGKPAACTAWSWNEAPTVEMSRNDDLAWHLTSALACASWLNGLMREGDTVRIATQAILIGGKWDAASIRVDPDGKQQPFYMPQGRVTALYSRYHGQSRLQATSEEIPASKPVPVPITDTSPVKLLDVVVTKSDNFLYVHAVNTSRTKSAFLNISLDGLDLGSKYVMHSLTGSIVLQTENPMQETTITEQTMEGAIKTSSRLKLTIPAATVTVTEIPLLQ